MRHEASFLKDILAAARKIEGKVVDHCSLLNAAQSG
jgi:hypothetical protein